MKRTRGGAILLMAALGLGACGTPARDGGASRAKSPEASGDDASQIATEPLVTHEVKAPEAQAGFLKKYAEATALRVETQGGVVKIGPVLSYFEAAWLAGLVPGATLSRRETYDEPAATAPFAKLKEAAGRSPIYVGTRRALGERFAIVTCEREEDDKDLELFQTHASGPRFLAKLPRKPALDMSSGLLFTKVGEEGTLLQVMNERKDGAVKAERLVAWRFGSTSREVLFDLPFFSLELGDKADPKVTVTRLEPKGTGVVITSWRVTLKKLAAAKEVSLALNDWSAEVWKDKPHPQLVELGKVEKIGERTSSLE